MEQGGGDVLRSNPVVDSVVKRVGKGLSFRG
jgi:hypothetical protein